MSTIFGLVPQRPHLNISLVQHSEGYRLRQTKLECDLASAHARAVQLDDLSSVSACHPTPSGSLILLLHSATRRRAKHP